MKAVQAKKRLIRIAVIDSDPLRFAGYCALLGSESDFELNCVSVTEIQTQQGFDVVLLSKQPGKNLMEMMAGLRARQPDLRVILTARGVDDHLILSALESGAKGCVDEAASADQLTRAIRIVLDGSVWAPRRVFAAFIEQASRVGRMSERQPITNRERDVLELLVAGRSNKEIAMPLGIEERTVKAHVSKLMRKVGVQNRIMLSVHAIANSLVLPGAV
jgi:DNA-binding NarL/FixJ family response regulator